MVTTTLRPLSVVGRQATIQAWTGGAGEPLVLIQYFRRSTRQHAVHLIPRFVDAGFTVVAVDPRAIGGNSGRLAGLTYHDLAADVAAVVRQEELGPVHLFATAAAAMVARCLAADSSELVRSLILTGPGAVGEPFPRQPDPDALEMYRKIFFGPPFDSEDRRRAIQSAAYSTASGVEAEVHDYELRELDTIEFLQLVAATPVSDYWHGGKAPMLVLQGLDDRICHFENSRALRDEFPDRVKLVEIPRAGHIVVNECPDVVVQETVRFVRSELVRSRLPAS